ncbi:o-succinylbenzoate--CoA ligase [Photorhabdus bodei]|uniref:O-succinylbenzoate--CoA ligase n=1 Tax=Photorhabdus bodei TaxID=2029681 RepID=A0ABX0AR07_9GAMM|nr:o-succinylbenzoate--CoA ligase [Photorhabdus bodei]NDK98943.1 o-succinylbenzoate--CoA ligase [Photorhabdus bodei]NDL03287.1 o-succinylbenzoate--CoA ligase [Photorhabdus bodei]NDL07401.1 o-succinylbenzoate--CoA ligase [Photorhabdus bodei]
MAQLNSFAQWPWRYWASFSPENIAVKLRNRSLTWHQLIISLDTIAANFRQQGIVEGSGVMLRGKNSEEMLFCYLAALQCGARVLPLNPQLPEMLLAKLLPHLNIDFVADFCGDNLLVINAKSLDWQSEPLNSDDNSVAWDAMRPASMILTSGSSGLPKAAVHSIHAHLSSARDVLSVMNFQQQDSWLLSLPLFHVSGQGIIWRWLMKGASLVLKNINPLERALADCTHASLVPTQLWRLLEQSQNQPPNLKEVLLGGAMIPVELTQRAERQGIRCWCSYGLTELASTVCVKRADELPGVGNPLPGKEVRLIKEEIQIRSDSLACGYWLDGKLQPLVDRDGWFHTRDRGVIQQGELRILGRMDNQFFSGGEGIQPEEIERMINTYPQVEQSFAVPVPDPEFGYRPVVVIDSNSPEIIDLLPEWLVDKLAAFQRPVAYYLLPKQFKNNGVKISRQQIRKWVMDLPGFP